MKATASVFVAVYLITVNAYSIPDPEIQLLSPRGFRVSIPDVNGIRLFVFNGNVNRNISLDQSGSISGEVFRSTSGRWIFEDSRTLIRKREVLYYWIYVQFNENPYKKTGSWTPSRTKPTGSCIPSITIVMPQSESTSICQGQLILEDNFDSLNSSIWSREIFIPAQPDYEFCAYHNHPEGVEIRNGILQIIPSSLEDSYGEGSTLIGTMTLAQCTSQLLSECTKAAVAYNILPPVISARFTTANHFSFRYGRVEIRAKFSEGDWLYPELWLQSKEPVHSLGFKSVRVRLGMARGNRVLTGMTKNYDGRVLEFGLRVGSAPNFRNEEVNLTSGDYWTSGFHVYSTTWNEDGFIFHVDGEEVGRLDPGTNGWFNSRNSLFATTNKMAPFDGQFYITLGLGVGGVIDFPDNVRSGVGETAYDKPWRNVAAKGMLRFWQAKDRWLPTWGGANTDKSRLQIDYVRVYAV